MKTKIILGIAAAASIAAIAAWQLDRLTAARNEAAELRAQAAEADALRQEVERLRQNDELKSEVARLRESVTAMNRQAGRVDLVQQPPAPAAANPDATNTANTNAQWVNGAVDLLKGAANFQAKAQIARAKERLNLSTNQENAIRGIVDNAIATGNENLRRVLSGSARADEVPSTEQWGAALEQQILSQLTPDQQAAYQKYKQEDQSATARLTANDELLRIQSSLRLSQEQQDQMFKILYVQALNGADPSTASPAGRPADPLAAFQWQVAEKLKAAESVLTPAQMATYRDMQQGSLDFVKWLATLGAGAPQR